MTGTDIRRFIPLKRVVAAALLDSYEDKTKSEELYYHFAGRGLRKLQKEVLKQGKRYTMLAVNKNTHTATLPVDFQQELFVGVVGTNGLKIPISCNDAIVNKYNIETEPEGSRCKACNQPSSICEDLAITETSRIITINGTDYEQKITKKLYPNGDYYLETVTPYLDANTSQIGHNTNREFISHFSLKPCGCIDENSTENILSLQSHCPDVYGCYYAKCDSCRTDFGSYRIFEESGLMQFDYHFPFNEVYIEYLGSMPKIKGQLSVPEVAFETLVEWIKYKSVQNRKNISRIERDQYFMNYQRERRNMEKILGRISLFSIIDAASRVPKFNITYQSDWRGYFDWNAQLKKAMAASSNGSSTSNDNNTGGNGSGTTTVVTNNYYNPAPAPVIVNGASFNSEGSYALPTTYKGWTILIFWNGLRYLLSNEYSVDTVNAIVTITLETRPFTNDDNYIISAKDKV